MLILSGKAFKDSLITDINQIPSLVAEELARVLEDSDNG
jgi:hypothetical protein